MLLGIKMTPAAAQVLKVNGIPQAMAVCVPVDLWQCYELDGTPIERSCYVMQLLHDLNDHMSKSRGDCAPLVNVAAVTLKWGIVSEMRDMMGRKCRELDPIINWINGQLRYQPAPQVAVREDGLALRIDATPVARIKFVDHEKSGVNLYPRCGAASRYARENNIPAAEFPGSYEHIISTGFRDLGSRKPGAVVWRQ